jgi:hypothetical protein
LIENIFILKCDWCGETISQQENTSIGLKAPCHLEGYDTEDLNWRVTKDFCCDLCEINYIENNYPIQIPGFKLVRVILVNENE